MKYYTEVVNGAVPRKFIITSPASTGDYREVLNPELVKHVPAEKYLTMELNAEGKVQAALHDRVPLVLEATPASVPADGVTVTTVGPFPAISGGWNIQIEGPIAPVNTLVSDEYLELTFTVPGVYTLKSRFQDIYLDDEVNINVTA